MFPKRSYRLCEPCAADWPRPCGTVPGIPRPCGNEPLGLGEPARDGRICQYQCQNHIPEINVPERMCLTWKCTTNGRPWRDGNSLPDAGPGTDSFRDRDSRGGLQLAGNSPKFAAPGHDRGAAAGDCGPPLEGGLSFQVNAG